MQTVEVFTDGSCIRKKSKKGSDACIRAGYGIHFPHGELPDVSRKFAHTPITNQRAELYAIYVALVIIKKNLDANKIIIYSDSEYSIKSVTIWISGWIKNSWRTSSGSVVKNQDIIEPIYNIITKLKNKKISVEFNHVRSHTGKTDYMSVNNAIADELATNGSSRV